MSTLYENDHMQPSPDTEGENDMQFIADQTQTIDIEPIATDPETPWYKKTAAKIVAAGSLALAGFGVGVGVTSGESSDDSEQPTALNSSPAPADSQASNSSETNLNQASNTEVQPNGPGFNINRILPEDETISATRPNGDEIVVPRLRSVDDSELFAESALSLLAAYTTTGDINLLNELTTNSRLQNTLRENREEEFMSWMAQSDSLDWQVKIYEDPNDPVVFKSGTGSSGSPDLELVSGTLLYYIVDDPVWQGENNREFDLAYSRNFKFTTLELSLNDDQQNPAVGAYDIETVRN